MNDIIYEAPATGIYAQTGASDLPKGQFTYWKAHSVIPATASAGAANLSFDTTMNTKVFFGRAGTGEVYEFYKVGKLTQKDMQKIRDMDVDILFQGAFYPKAWSIDGEILPVTQKVELNPQELDKMARSYAGLI